MLSCHRYSYSKTRGLFGGLSVEGSVIVERQDANAQAYKSDVTAKRLLSGSVPPPPWAMELIKTIEHCTGPPGGRSWVQDGGGEQGYAFGGMASDAQPTRRKKASSVSSFPPASWGRSKTSGSYFQPESGDEADIGTTKPDIPLAVEEYDPATFNFPTHFDSDEPSYTNYTRKSQSSYPSTFQPGPLDTAHTSASSKSLSMLPPPYSSNPFAPAHTRSQTNPFISSHPDAIGHAIALFDFKVIEVYFIALHTIAVEADMLM
jgi:SH3 domain-containing YSC84-like protein 1